MPPALGTDYFLRLVGHATPEVKDALVAWLARHSTHHVARVVDTADDCGVFATVRFRAPKATTDVRQLLERHLSAWSGITVTARVLKEPPIMAATRKLLAVRTADAGTIAGWSAGELDAPECSRVGDESEPKRMRYSDSSREDAGSDSSSDSGDSSDRDVSGLGLGLGFDGFKVVLRVRQAKLHAKVAALPYAEVLVAVAGLRCSGKTTLINDLIAKQWPDALVVRACHMWTRRRARDFIRSRTGASSIAVVHVRESALYDGAREATELLIASRKTARLAVIVETQLLSDAPFVYDIVCTFPSRVRRAEEYVWRQYFYSLTFREYSNMISMLPPYCALSMCTRDLVTGKEFRYVTVDAAREAVNAARVPDAFGTRRLERGGGLPLGPPAAPGTKSELGTYARV